MIVSAALLLGAGAQALASSGGAAGRIRVYATYYGWYDNTPPGCATAYSGCAGGTGTFADPLTFASDTAEFLVGTIVYYPTVRKYFRMGDSCQECSLDWSGHGPNGGPHLYHVDLWLGGAGGNEFDAIDCEDALTRERPDGAPVLTTFLVDPPDDLPVSSQPLFNTSTGHCFGGAKAKSTTGSYRNGSTGHCLADERPRLGEPATTGVCDRATDERIVFNGAFLIHAKRCLKTTGPEYGARIVWAACDGDAREQWEINPNGTITWVQYTRCVAAEHDRVVLTRCTGHKAERWKFAAVRRRSPHA